MDSVQREYSIFKVVWASGLLGVGEFGWLSVCEQWVVGGCLVCVTVSQ